MIPMRPLSLKSNTMLNLASNIDLRIPYNPAVDLHITDQEHSMIRGKLIRQQGGTALSQKTANSVKKAHGIYSSISEVGNNFSRGPY